MARRSPARFLAPLAVVAVAVAFYAVLSHGLSDSGAGKTPPAAETRGKATPTGTRTSSSSPKRKRKTYVIKSGDTPSSIAQKTGVPLAEIERLNPDLDPQLLSPGTRIKLRE
jgi:LysM repeat protein